MTEDPPLAISHSYLGTLLLGGVRSKMWKLDQVLSQSLEPWHMGYELLWMKIVIDDLKIKYKGPMMLFCDNK